ncbi:MAG: hypothetical protein JNK77_16090 [Saprospiraceae bacterium]|nr:hypothetical protein [Saprospiraceae bacterium]
MKTSNIILLQMGLSALLVFTMCCPVNPGLNTILTAHGNTDWHIDTAEEFITGKDMKNNNTAANHVPSTWTGRHMHVGLTNTAHFYYDVDKTTPGDDANATNGIDQAMLFFYAGHGSPTGWNTLGDNGTQSKMQLGDCPGYGLLRYYWQCSCEVFAHGPRTGTGATFDYSWPGKFTGGADSYDQRNIYERWGPALHPYLRMACGASTPAYCHESQVNSIWNNYNNLGMEVSDAFIDGLTYYNNGVVPVCITTGGFDVSTTPLNDLVFTNQANISENTYYHIQYLGGFDRQLIQPFLMIRIPELLPELELIPMPRPDPILRVQLEEQGDWLIAREQTKEKVPTIRINKLSGAVYLKENRMTQLSTAVLSEREYLQKAQTFVKEKGWVENNMKLTEANHMMLEKQDKASEKKFDPIQKNVVIVFKRQVEVDGQLIPVLGEGGQIKIQLNNDGSVLNAAKIWRAVDVRATLKKTRVKPYETALEEARKRLPDRNAYKLERWDFGYEELAGNVEQKVMKTVYHFYFVPENKEQFLEFPPMFMAVPAQ